MAPLSDRMCAEAWENVTRLLSQTIAGKNRGDHVKGRHWRRTTDACGLNRTMIPRRDATLSRRTRRELPAAVEAIRAMPGGNHPRLDAVAAAIDARCRTVLVDVTQL